MSKYEPKTVATDDSVIDYLATLDESQQRDSRTLIRMMRDASGEPPVLWGKIIGFGTYHYKTKSGNEADWPLIAFAPRKGKLSLYLTYDAADFADDLAQVGKHDIGKGCVYMKNLDGANIDALEALITKAYEKSKAQLVIQKEGGA